MFVKFIKKLTKILKNINKDLTPWSVLVKDKNTGRLVYNLIMNKKKFRTKEEVTKFLKNKYKKQNYKFIITEI